MTAQTDTLIIGAASYLSTATSERLGLPDRGQSDLCRRKARSEKSMVLPLMLPDTGYTYGIPIFAMVLELMGDDIFFASGE